MIHRILSLAVAMVALSTSWSSIANAQGYRSIWDQRDMRYENLYNDLKARNKGDILTIVVSERTDVANTDSRQLDKQASAGTSLNGSFDTGSSSGEGSAGFDSSGQRKFSGGSNFSSDREFADRFTVTVVDVLPNGNMLIAGKRNVLVEGDVRELSVTGVVRGLDILPDNTIRSFQVADLRMEWSGEGTDTKFTRQGWLGRQLNNIWPF